MLHVALTLLPCGRTTAVYLPVLLGAFDRYKAPPLLLVLVLSSG